jgi:hypothetical protein
MLSGAERVVSVYELVAFSIDFEGSISISTSIGRYGGTSFQPVVSIGGTSLTLLNAFCSRVGFGNVTQNPTYNAHRSPVHYWIIRPRGLREHLHRIEPYLVLKRQQARLLLESLTLIKDRRSPGQRTKRPQEVTDRLMAIHDELQVLNTSPCYKQNLTDAQKLLIELRKVGR